MAAGPKGLAAGTQHGREERAVRLRHKARKGGLLERQHIFKELALSVFVLDQSKRPLMPCSQKRARKLLSSGRARIHRLFPFAIRLIDRTVEDSSLQPLRLSIDPGSKVTGLALCRVEEAIDASTGEIQTPVMHISFLMELVHRGQAIKDALHARAAMRRTRRTRNLRYRAPRFDNRGGDKMGWVAPSLMHRVLTTQTWVNRISTDVTRLANPPEMNRVGGRLATDHINVSRRLIG